MKSRRRTSNENLPDLPTDTAVLQAIADLVDINPRRELHVTAQRIAWKLDVQGARRHGRGAVAHSWTGTMAPALRIAPRLRSLSKRGLVWEVYDTERHRRCYGLTEKGRGAVGP